MNVALRRRMTPEDFLAWAEGQTGRYEFDGFEPVAMTGGTNNHGTIVGNVVSQLQSRLRGSPCRRMTAEGGGVATIGDAVRYPDATVTCTRFGGRERLIPDPMVVFEVLSPSSAHIDLVVKPIEYKAVPSIKRYVVIDQAKVEVHGYVRGDDGGWREMEPLSAGATLALPEIGIVLTVDDIYEDVAFDAA